MTFKLIPRRKLKVVLKGFIQTAIQYVVRVTGTNPWLSFFPTYENQRWGNWDSDDCWCLSAVQNATFNLNWILKNNMFGTEALNFWNSNGFIVNGTFQLSELFHEILCGNLDNGGTSPEAWQSFQARGFIPRSMLNYSQVLAQNDPTDLIFIEDYYNTSRVTPAMLALGQQSLKYISIAYQSLSANTMIMQAALQQAPLNIGIPVEPTQWNQVNVPLNTSKLYCHEVSLYWINPDNSLCINDQYQPNPKVLAAGYSIGPVTQGIINAVAPAVVISVPQPTGTMNDSWWTMIEGWFNGIFYPNAKIGSA
jgi:hypothetical protein